MPALLTLSRYFLSFNYLLTASFMSKIIPNKVWVEISTPKEYLFLIWVSGALSYRLLKDNTCNIIKKHWFGLLEKIS